ncbi:MAG: PAS domain-containing protein [Synergistaceae bacterium]|jgi:signal transduction histidine kinase|nr:PAS domain-containing protein [Synergistaceae bacterium]
MSRTDDDRYYIKEMERLGGENAEVKAGLREPGLGASAAENGCQGKYLAMILDNSKDIIAITDRGGRIVCCTEELLRLAGVQSCALIRGRNFSEIFEPYMPGASDGTSWERVVENVAANKTGAQLPLTLDIGGRGTPRSYMVHVTPMLEGGEIDGFMILASDATELIHAKKMAEQASEAKSNFLAQMSHGIRTPMNAIIGMTELMRTDNFDAIQLEYLESINKMSRSVLQIINDILDFSKAEAGRMKLVPADFDITVLYDSMCSIMELAAAEKSLEFKCSFGEGLPRVLYGDELRTRQILTNVLNNAVKYTNEGFVSFTVEKRTRHLRDHIVFVVRDSGIGIKKEDFSKLFDSFEQLDSARERAIIGTGLGLAITKKLVALMEGFIELESEYGRGSAFTVWIPLTEGDASKTETTADLERVVAAGGAEVLVVDDN